LNTLVLTVHVIACVSLVILVLLQSGHEGMGVIFGGSSSTLFGSSGAGGFLSKLTVTMAVLFFVTSLSFTFIDAQKKSSEPASIMLEKSDTGAKPAAPAPAQQPGESEKPGQDDGSGQ